MYKIVNAKAFDYTILFFIFASSVHLALDNPLNDPKGKLTEILFYIDIAITGIFVIEAIMKILALGFISNGEESYLRNYWNTLDFIIVIISVRFFLNSAQILSIVFEDLDLNALKAIRIFRVLRPLRLIARN